MTHQEHRPGQPTPPQLRWARWRRGGGQHASHPVAGPQLYSLTPVRTPGGSYTGRYELTDFHHRTGRCETVPSKEAGQALAEQWLADGPADDGHARLRAAWGSWHESVPDGQVGVAVVLPGTGEPAHALVTKPVYQAAMGDPERRIPVEQLALGAFTIETHTKQVTLPQLLGQLAGGEDDATSR